MGLDDRDYIRGEHPPACTCVECNRKRLGRFNQESKGKDKQYSLKIKGKDNKMQQRNTKQINRHNSLLTLIIILLVISILAGTTLYTIVSLKKITPAQILQIPQNAPAQIIPVAPQMPTPPQQIQNIAEFNIFPFEITYVGITVTNYKLSSTSLTIVITPNSSTQSNTSYVIQINNRSDSSLRSQITASWDPASLQAEIPLSILIPATKDEITNYTMAPGYYGNQPTNSSPNESLNYLYILTTVNGYTEQELITQENQESNQQYQQEISQINQQYQQEVIQSNQQYQEEVNSVTLQQKEIEAQQVVLNNQHQSLVQKKSTMEKYILFIFISIIVILVIVIILIKRKGK